MEKTQTNLSINEKHLEFLQANITRMNQCSFQMKGWAITIASALIALHVTGFSKCDCHNIFIWIAIAPTFLFWLLDAFYLSREHKFIGIYNDVARITPDSIRREVKDYAMPLNQYRGWHYSYIRAFIASISTIGFYGIIILGLILLGALL